MIKRTLTGIGMAVWLMQTPAQANILYVDASATGNNNGVTWINAYSSLQSALSAAVSNDQVWVAQGTYYPTNGTNRNATFQLKSGVNLYGGFTNGMNSLGSRDWQTHETILSGEIGAATNADNCYHVVTATGAAGITLDGFTVTRGYNEVNTDPTRNGAGLLVYQSEVFPTIVNCRFTDNTAYYRGGAIAFVYTGNGNVGPVISNCTFTANSTIYSSGLGGAIYMYHRKPITIRNSVFDNNSSYQGAALYAYYCDPIITACTFSRNKGSNSGGAIYHLRVDTTSIHDSEISDCLFYANTAGGHGGAVYYDRAYHTGDVIRTSRFYANSSSAYTAGGLYLNKYGGSLSDSIFSGNRVAAAASDGGAIGVFYSGALLKRLTVVGNTAGHSGGGLYFGSSSNPDIENCLVAGNRAVYYGGGLCLYDVGSTLKIINLTVAKNHAVTAGYGGGGIYHRQGTLDLENSVVYNNTTGGGGAQIFSDLAAAVLDVGFCDIEGGLTGIYRPNNAALIDNGGNITNSPLFVGGSGRTWTAAGQYTNSTGLTTLTDTGSAWTAGSLAGKLLNPNTASNLMYYVVANTETNITVLGDASAAQSGNSYQLYDYQLGAGSPCADTASDALAPADDILKTARPQGPRVDMGAYERPYAVPPVKQGPVIRWD